MKISWFSNAPWAATGYGNQTKLFVPRIKELGHDIAVTAFYGLEGGIITWEGIPIFPRAKNPYGLDIIGAAAYAQKADIVITLLDAWVFAPQTIGLPWYPWFPIDHEPMPREVADKVRQARKAIVYSKFGKEQAEAAGIEVYYVPHGTDTQVMKPCSKAEARKALGLPEDSYVVGMVAANKGIPPRKSFFEQIAAFAALRKQHKDAVLYLHTEDGSMKHPEQADLIEYSRLVGLIPGKNVFFPDQYRMVLGHSDQYMQYAFNSMDVLMSVSKGEGFGIPILEAQACGTPVIVGDWTSMSELCFSGWKVGKDEAEHEYDAFFHSFWYKTHAGAVADRLFAAYEMRGNKSYSDMARKGALAYDADKVTEKYWKPVLSDIAERVEYEKSAAQVAQESQK